MFSVHSEIWNRFLEFESSVGDLASILKVEKRRALVIGKVSLECPSLFQLTYFFVLQLPK